MGASHKVNAYDAKSPPGYKELEGRQGADYDI